MRLILLAVIMVFIAVLSMADELSQVRCRIVDYGADVGGGYYSRWQGHNPDKNIKIDVDGDGKTDDDVVAFVPFSLTEPMSPAYSEYDADAVNAVFYGGITAYFANNPRGAITEGMLNSNHELRDDFNMMTIRSPFPDEKSKITGFWFWDKKHFLNGGDKNKVTFDDDSTIVPYVSRYWQFLDEGRWVVRDGDQFYISKEIFKGDRKSHVLHPTKSEWTIYNPKAPYEIEFDDKTAKFSPHIFSDVTAVGFFITRRELAWVSTALKWNAFEVTAVVNRPVSPGYYADMVKITPVEQKTAVYIGKTEVSYSLWSKVYKWAVSNQYCFDYSPPGYVFDKDGDMGSMDLGGKHDATEPATDMTWYDAVAWCNALSELEGKTPCYYADEAKTKVLRNIKERVNPAKYGTEATVYVKWDANGYRLPTTGEWVKAATGNNEKMNREDKDGWIAVNADKTTHPVGKKAANASGLHDMLGNVWEYCWDVSGDNFNPANQTKHTVLGGDFSYPADPTANPLLKFGETPFNGNYNIGMRVVRADAGLTADLLPKSIQLSEKAVAIDAIVPQWNIERGLRVLPEGKQKITLPEGLEMVQIPAGGFLRPDDADVKLTEFKINKSEITYDSWRVVYQWAVMNNYVFDADGDMGSMDYQADAHGHDGNEPVTDITWKDAALWCNALSEMTGKTPCYYTDTEKKLVYRRANQWRIAMYLGQMGYAVGKEEEKFLPVYCRWHADGYRLPTDAEWEYVYRDGIREQYPPIQYIGGKSFGDFGWTGANSGGTTHAVKTKKPNNYGVYDMEGNVSEWGWDWQGYDYYRSKDPKGDNKSGLFGKLIHGSNYGGEPVPFWRFFQDDPSVTRPTFGFRVVQCQADAHPAEDKFVPDVVLKIDEKDYSLLQGQVWRGNLCRTGVLDVKGVSELKGVKWKFKTDGKVRSSPVVVNGIVYIGSSDKNVYAIDVKTGDKKWQFATGDEVLSSAAVVNGVVYIGSNDGYLYALDADKGTMVWKFSRKKGPVKSSPAFAYGTVFAGFGTYGGGSLSGVDMKTGKENWRYRFQAGPSAATSPAIYGTGIYCPSPSIYSYAADIATEQTLWTTVMVASHVPPALTEDTIYILGSDMMALDRISGKFKWRVKIPGTREALMEFHDSAPVVYKDFVYFGANNKTYNAVDAKTGEKKWSVDLGGQVQSSGIFANGIIYVGCTDKYLYALDAKTGATKWKYLTDGWVNSSPWATDDCVIVGCDDGYVYAIE